MGRRVNAAARSKVPITELAQGGKYNMNLGLRKEEAEFLYDNIIATCKIIGIHTIKEIYGDIDIEGILNQLQYIIALGENLDEK